MPVISESTYRPPLLFSNPHVQTVFPSVFRKVNGVSYRRERIDTPDDDFLDLDFSTVGSSRIVIVLHGLEGDSGRAYVTGMVKAFNRRGWDALALNFRGCGGEINRQLRFYHSGDTEDLQTTIDYVIAKNTYSEIALIGFSVGGNVVLKYLGERGTNVPPLIEKAVVFSVPCDLATSAVKIASQENRIYMKRFLRMLHRKIRMKMRAMPGSIHDEGFDRIKDFRDFDNRYTAVFHGFKGAEDYWSSSSSKQFLAGIAMPTLLVSAQDDPFLTQECFPADEAASSSSFFLEVPAHGGHVGFVTFNNGGEYWSESRAADFIAGPGS
jgi:uncharacterized protein